MHVCRPGAVLRALPLGQGVAGSPGLRSSEPRSPRGTCAQPQARGQLQGRGLQLQPAQHAVVFLQKRKWELWSKPPALLKKRLHSLQPPAVPSPRAHALLGRLPASSSKRSRGARRALGAHPGPGLRALYGGRWGQSPGGSSSHFSLSAAATAPTWPQAGFRGATIGACLGTPALTRPCEGSACGYGDGDSVSAAVQATLLPCTQCTQSALPPPAPCDEGVGEGTRVTAGRTRQGR